MLAAAQPQLIILDVHLSTLEGIAVFQQLRADPATRTIPVIFFTATEARVRQRLPDYEQQGASFVGKPNIAHLSAQIKQLLTPAA
jgi:CheY-like chemotaxis protein